MAFAGIRETQKGHESQVNVSSKGLSSKTKEVLAFLHNIGPLTQKDIVAGSGIPTRTVRHALTELIAHGLIAKDPSLVDTRQHYYRAL